MEKNRFNKKIAAFEALLAAVSVQRVSPEIYCQKYLRHLLGHTKYYLSIYADVLEKLIHLSPKNEGSITLVDFGAGNGLLGIFAKYCGFRKVFINDIDKKFVDASEKLSQQMNIDIDGFIAGDISTVKFFLKDEPLDAIAGTDVIEHIYSLDDFFSILKEINPQLVSVFTTAANPKNYFKVKQLKKLQFNDEYKGGTPDDFILFGDKAHKPFFETRKQIILSQLENPDKQLSLVLAKATRGMNEKDVLLSVKKYKQTGYIPVPPVHPTNTCNPANSSWTERILSLTEYHTLYNSYGYMLIISNGFYDEHKKGLKKIINTILNAGVRILGIHLAPYIIFQGQKIKQKNGC